MPRGLFHARCRSVQIADSLLPITSGACTNRPHMSDIQLFRLVDKVATEIKGSSSELEKPLQNLIEAPVTLARRRCLTITAFVR